MWYNQRKKIESRKTLHGSGSGKLLLFKLLELPPLLRLFQLVMKQTSIQEFVLHRRVEKLEEFLLLSSQIKLPRAHQKSSSSG